MVGREDHPEADTGQSVVVVVVDGLGFETGLEDIGALDG